MFGNQVALDCAIKVTPEKKDKEDKKTHEKTAEKLFGQRCQELADESEYFVGKDSETWFYFDRENAREDRFLPIFKKSKFFSDPAYFFASYSGLICNSYYHLLIVDPTDPAHQKITFKSLIEHELKDKTEPLVQKFNELMHVFEELSPAQQVTARQEIIDGLACRYKIHLQVKPEFREQVVNHLLQRLDEEDTFNWVTSFKVAKKYVPGRNCFNADGKCPENPSPIIVLYVALLPGIREEKNARLNMYIHRLEELFEGNIEKIALKITPRFNLKINDLIYIAGGEGWNKQIYLNCGYKDRLSKIFTDNLVFFRGYEFEYQPLSLVIPD